jgi:hypothetical protein
VGGGSESKDSPRLASTRLGGLGPGPTSNQNERRKEQMANECVIMKVPKIKREEDCWVIDGWRITPESLGKILDRSGENETILRAHVPGRKGGGCKKKQKKRSLKVGHETLHEFIYFLVGPGR